MHKAKLMLFLPYFALFFVKLWWWIHLISESEFMLPEPQLIISPHFTRPELFVDFCVVCRKHYRLNVLHCAPSPSSLRWRSSSAPRRDTWDMRRGVSWPSCWRRVPTPLCCLMKWTRPILMFLLSCCSSSMRCVYEHKETGRGLSPFPVSVWYNIY